VSTGKVTPISGFLEFLPDQRIVEQHVLDVIREVFELHGFVSIETRAVEPVERLLGKGGDADKEIYGISRLAADATDAREPSLGLHFDLTVPFARYVAGKRRQAGVPVPALPDAEVVARGAAAGGALPRVHPVRHRRRRRG
jgi:histidyl-tRNA synthetase